MTRLIDQLLPLRRWRWWRWLALVISCFGLWPLTIDVDAKVLIIQDQMMKMSDKQTLSTAMLDEMQIFREHRGSHHQHQHQQQHQQQQQQPIDFDQIHFDGDNILVGARNAFFNISLLTMEEYKKVVWNSTAKDIHLCRLKQKTADECQNYIRVIVKVEPEVYVICGTNAYYPLCRTYRYDQQTGGYAVVEEEIGIARSPYGPTYNSTAIYAGGKMYSATAADVSSRDSLIYSRPLRTEQHDSQWLNDPQFVKSFEYGDKVLFFFRETSIENINCGKVIFSRVARVCKSDTGGSRILRHTWTSFFKTRLNCSIPGKFPFYFDEIQSTTDLGKGNVYPTLVRTDRTSMIYAVFSTPRNSIRGSAVCAYRMSDIVKSFDGPFKEQKAPNANWLPVKVKDVPFPHPASTCSNSSTTLGDHKLNFIKSHPLMDQAVPSFGGQPILVQTGFHFTLTQIAVDWQVYAADRRYYDILFIGTDDGRVIKAINRGKGHHQVETVVIEVMQVFDDRSAVKKLRVFRNLEQGQEKLIAVSATGIRTIPLHRCHFMTSCSSCVALRDPYCSWFKDRCTNSYMGYQSIDAGQHMRCIIENITKTNRDQTRVFAPNRCNACNCWSSITSEDGEDDDDDDDDDDEAGNSIDNFPRSASALSHNIQVFGDDDDDTKSPITGPCYPDPWQGGGKLYSAETMALTSVLCILASLLTGCLTGYGLATCRHSSARGVVADKYSDVADIGDYCHGGGTPVSSVLKKDPMGGSKPRIGNDIWTNGFTGDGVVTKGQLKMILNPYGQNVTVSSRDSCSDGGPPASVGGQSGKVRL